MIRRVPTNARFAEQPLALLVLGLMLVLFRVPFFWTHHIQEDAYISIRCARNLADLGIYGFNPGEPVSASTSHAYVFVLAALRYLFGDGFIWTALLLNTALLLTGAYLLVSAVGQTGRQRRVLWTLVSTTPVALMISYSGMETSLLVALVGTLVYALATARRGAALTLSLLALPWVRPDAVAIGMLVLALVLFADRQIPWKAAGSLLLGVASLLGFNDFYFGGWLNQTIVAKMTAYRPAYSWASTTKSIVTTFLGDTGGGNGVFSPIQTKYLASASPWFAALALASVAVLIWRSRPDRDQLAAALAVAGIAVLLPIAYAVGGTVSPWYVQPSALCGMLAVVGLVLRIPHPAGARLSGRTLVPCGLVVAGLAAGQLAFSFSWGTQERDYRGGIGEYLGQIAGPRDTLLLEPAGYIPYYSGLYTYDEVGLVSPLVTAFRQTYGKRYWIELLKREAPSFLVERSHMLSYTTWDGYVLTEEERRWFDAHYHRVKDFHYNPADYFQHPLLLRLLALGSASDYHLYRWVGALPAGSGIPPTVGNRR